MRAMDLPGTLSFVQGVVDCGDGGYLGQDPCSEEPMCFPLWKSTLGGCIWKGKQHLLLVSGASPGGWPGGGGSVPGHVLGCWGACYRTSPPGLEGFLGFRGEGWLPSGAVS